jgi:hypothetical protein
MSYVSIFKNIPDFLSQPTGIAAIASIGIHGAIAFILPLMPVDSKPKVVTSSKGVGLVELSQAEQQRLPENSMAPKVGLQAQIPLPNTNSTLPNQVGFPPLPPGSSTSLILPPVPKSISNYPTYSLPRSQALDLIPGSRFNPGRSSYTPYTAYNPGSRRGMYNIPSSPTSYAVPSQWKASDRTTTAGVNNNPNYATNESTNTNTSNVPSQELVAPVKSAFEPGSDYTVAATDRFQEFQPDSATNNAVATPSPSREITALNSYQDLRQGIRRAYPGAEEKAVIRKIISTDKVALQGDVMGMLVIDADGKVVDVLFQSDKSVSPAQKVAIRKYFLKNPPPATKNLASYPFSLSLQNGSNVAVENQTQPIVTPSSNQSLGQKLRQTNNQPAQIKTPVQVAPLPNNNNNQQAVSPNQPVRIKTPVQVAPLPNNNNNQQAVSPNQPVKIKTPVQVTPSQDNQQSVNSQPNSKKLINQLRQVREERQNQ